MSVIMDEALKDENSNTIYPYQPFFDFKLNTEQRVGTWTDGKPLYRYIISGTKSASTDFTTNLPSGIDKIAMVDGWLYTTQNVIKYLTQYKDANNNVRYEVNTASSPYVFKVSGTASSAYYYGPFIGIVYYTKTSDSSNS